MKVLVSSFLLLVALSTMANAQTITGKVNRAIDGDTFAYEGNVRIRLCGINAPEINRAGGIEAKKFLQNLIKGKDVSCKIVGGGTPCDNRSDYISYNRIVAQCFLGVEDISKTIRKSGHAKDIAKYSGGYYK